MDDSEGADAGGRSFWQLECPELSISDGTSLILEGTASLRCGTCIYTERLHKKIKNWALVSDGWKTLALVTFWGSERRNPRLQNPTYLLRTLKLVTTCFDEKQILN